MISDIIKQKMVFTNLTQAKLANLIGTSPTQLGLFLKGEGASLPIKQLEKCLDVLEINTEVYGRIYSSASKVAAILKSRDYDTEKVLRMEKQEMIILTNSPELKYLIDIKDENEIDILKSSGLIDIQMTFPYFKGMVVYLMSLGDKTSTRTSTSVKSLLLSKLFGATAVTGMLVGGVAAVGATVVTALGTGILNTISKEDNRPLNVLKELAKQIIKIK